MSETNFDLIGIIETTTTVNSNYGPIPILFWNEHNKLKHEYNKMKQENKELRDKLCIKIDGELASLRTENVNLENEIEKEESETPCFHSRG